MQRTPESVSILPAVSVRRKLFASSEDTGSKRQRGPRCIDTVRCRRRRYRKTKKLKNKEAWEQKLLEDMCIRWKERREQYSKAEENERLLVQEQEANHDAIFQQNEVYRHIESTCRREIASCQQVLYDKVADDSLHASYDTLLLPSVTVPDRSYSTVTQEDLALPVAIKGVDRVAVVSAVQVEREKTRKALLEARHYRNLSERLRKEKCELASSMNEKVELIRDFWRNNVKEGSTRGGKMVQKALQNYHQVS